MKIVTIITCTSFTGVMLLFVLLSPYNMAPVVNRAVTVQVFLMTLSIGLLLLLQEKIEDKLESDTLPVTILIRLGICYAVVFLEGSAFGMIEFSWKGVMEITPILIPVFLITYAVSYFNCAQWAENINECIQKKRNG